MSLQDGGVTNDYPLKCGSFQLITNPSLDYVLTSDANGVGTWKSAGASIDNIVPQDASIAVVAVTPGEVKIGATGNFVSKDIITNGQEMIASSPLIGIATTGGPGLKSYGTSGATISAADLFNVGLYVTIGTAGPSLNWPSLADMDAQCPTGWNVANNGFYFMISNNSTGAGGLNLVNSSDVQTPYGGALNMVNKTSRVFWAQRQAGAWIIY